VSNPSYGVAEINAFKLEYSFHLFFRGPASRQQVEDFVSRCLRVYRVVARPGRGSSLSTIESQPSDDLYLLAAMSLIHVSEHDNRSQQNKAPSSALVRAASILERLLLDSPHNYQALLLLVRIYLLLGAGSLALKTFSKLTIKQMQYETVAHNLFTRLSTIHPHSAPPYDGAELKDFNPQLALIQALTFYRSADATSTKSRMNGLVNGSYLNIEESIGFQELLRRSICRKMWALDVRRMQRLVGGDPTGRYNELGMLPHDDEVRFDF
jgi:N-terminal acetyltransferase B complex non-catalytic subunit